MFSKNPAGFYVILMIANAHGVKFVRSRATLRHHTLHGLNRMQMRKILYSPSNTDSNSAHVKYGVWTGFNVIILLRKPQLRTAEGNSVYRGDLYLYTHNYIRSMHWRRKKLTILECSFLFGLSVLFLNYSYSCSSSLWLKVKATELFGVRNF